ncbi:DNA translocase FtsK [Tistrella bauzanensis]|uniref:DNA translocase FtsK n=1 Tax=Tistrella bauzanensis TaxID=657419 RepID=A0ABQ1INX5_9PROT|nr:DNA translocase FtsK [Tistrella bauzanensis]GGB48790.1 DNA translocase FtsK [Tistrella bauzanensis]
MAARLTGNARTNRFLPAGAAGVFARLGGVAGGLCVAAAALCLILALASYDPTDPSLNNTSEFPLVNNLLGLSGAYFADMSLQALGLGALMLPLVMLGWSWRLMRGRGLPMLWLNLTILPVALVTTAGLAAAFGRPEGWPLESGLGGVVGMLLYARLTAIIGVGPYLVVTLGLTLLGGFAASGMALGDWQRIGGGIAAGAGLIARGGGALARLGRRGDDDGDPRAAARDRRRAARLARQGQPEGRRQSEPRFDDDAPPPVARRREAVAAEASSPDGPGREGGPRIGAPRRNIEAAAAEARRRNPLDLDDGGNYRLPALDLLALAPRGSGQGQDPGLLAEQARGLEKVLEDYGVKGRIVEVRPGPVVTLFELEPAPGIKSSRVISLADDIARSMSAISARVAVIPGRNAIGIELPNPRRETVYLRELLASESYENTASRLALALGKDIGGVPVVADLARMPHLLVAGTTGSGKSVAINTMILSLLYRLSPDQCKFIMIDPKMLELSVYEGIPHLLAPVVTEPGKAVVALKWAVREMEGRYRAMSNLGVRNIGGYNKRVAEARDAGEVLTRTVQTGFDAETGKPVFEEQGLETEPMPYIVVVVDEMADLMLVAGKDIEAAIQRLAQMARAAGIHLIMATQRPSVDVITGTIKANFPTRISFQVTSKIDSRTILGEQGAEQLLGQGDMLHMEGGGRITRVHGPFVSDEEVEKVVRALKEQGMPSYIEAVTDDPELAQSTTAELIGSGSGGGGGEDDLYDQALAVVLRERRASTSFIQRHLQIGYNRAARLIERMENEGVVSRADRTGRREVLLGEQGAD